MKNENICYISYFINALNISENLTRLITRIDCYIGRELRNIKFIKGLKGEKRWVGTKYKNATGLTTTVYRV